MIKFSLTAARENSGLTMKEAAKELGIHDQTLSKWEKDSTKIPMELLNKMVSLYQIPLDYIFLGKKYDLIRTLRESREKQLA